MQVLKIVRQLWRPGYIAALIAVVIAVGSLMPAEDMGSISGSDLARHVFAYCLFSFFAVSAVTGRLNSSLVLLGVFGFGVALEFIQPFFERAFDFNDVIANAAGVLAGLCAAFGFQHAVERLGHGHSLNSID